MRQILLIKGNYDRADGGQPMVSTQLSAMNRARYQVTLALLQKPGSPASALLDGSTPETPVEQIEWAGLLGGRRPAGRVREIVRRRSVQLIHTHDMRANLSAYLMTRTTRVTWVAHVHGWLGHTHTARYRAYETIDRWLIGKADVVVVGSTATRDEAHAAGAKKTCGADSERGPRPGTGTRSNGRRICSARSRLPKR